MKKKLSVLILLGAILPFLFISVPSSGATVYLSTKITWIELADDGDGGTGGDKGELDLKYPDGDYVNLYDYISPVIDSYVSTSENPYHVMYYTIGSWYTFQIWDQDGWPNPDDKIFEFKLKIHTSYDDTFSVNMDDSHEMYPTIYTILVGETSIISFQITFRSAYAHPPPLGTFDNGIVFSVNIIP
ncbi:MAG: hypothetical protein HeimC3_02460 [Candidatus Heimdallarchaeota archaeon LC_3]|nr:MAG: hypothetical protein HeimC3_49510 [Candidatus Heimdallarchaeota archaeon LC_3]OLS27669.1 MAG: hypothetical protein HeimC3_02460 [Candidatus Heimdallarchaeota archaeon LC_3]